MTYEWEVDEVPGTYWYHTHSGLESGGARGVFGALIVEPKVTPSYYNNVIDDMTLLVSDFFHKSSMYRFVESKGGLHHGPSTSSDGHSIGTSGRFETFTVNGHPSRVTSKTSANKVISINAGDDLQKTGIAQENYQSVMDQLYETFMIDPLSYTAAAEQHNDNQHLVGVNVRVNVRECTCVNVREMCACQTLSLKVSSLTLMFCRPSCSHTQRERDRERDR